MCFTCRSVPIRLPTENSATDRLRGVPLDVLMHDFRRPPSDP
jgi:hypothetical protein